ncbi:response regulator transcription factor [Rhodococcoides yunnanense]|uniref:Response regulator transcription factor n=1 Tax=Rhodococcoides yunnanense TaxID=278209 RepID=A0ABU4BIB8_9NOCA|nr:response regulator transcription factor [Rhodococcus yunnanensis]MDV6263925.1 response regulator transcription factor [Rhodococcus yunnanensis]
MDGDALTWGGVRVLNNFIFLSAALGTVSGERVEPRTPPTFRALVFEPGSAACSELPRELQSHGSIVVVAHDERRAIELAVNSDIVILDPDGLSGRDGLELCRLIRRVSNVPIIVVTGPDSDFDPVSGFMAGIDDLVVKPYDLRELEARIEAVLRRIRGAALVTQHPEEVLFGELKINTTLREVDVAGRSVALTRKEFDLLHLLASNPDTIVPRAQIMDQVWDGSWSSRTVDTHVSSLRSKLGSRRWIMTIRGVGFRLVRVA